MKKVWIWIAVVCMVAGIVLLIGAALTVGFDFMKFDSQKYVKNSYNITESFTDISIDTITADVIIRPAEDGKCRVECYEKEKVRHTVSVENSTLSITAVDSRNWMDHISIFSFKTTSVTVYLPLGDYQALKVNNTTGDVKVTGQWNVGKVSLTTTTGDILLEELTCADLTAKGSTGKATFKGVIASGKVQINRSTGDVKFDRCEAGELYVSVTTGSVNGTFLKEMDVSARSSTGRVDVPDGKNGGRCEITTTTGDIRIRFV
jgi:DUF4097 and DUF4098 domain-containing protein YvlB